MLSSSRRLNGIVRRACPSLWAPQVKAKSARPQYLTTFRSIAYPYRRLLSVHSEARPSNAFLASSLAAGDLSTSDTSSWTSRGDQLPRAERPKAVLTPLPRSCPGCGALSQEVLTEEAGYYTRSRKAVKNYLRHVRNEDQETSKEDRGDTPAADRQKPGETTTDRQTKAPDIPICDRCHELIYQSKGVSISHPSIDAIADSIAESPFRSNHVYHVLDAADFPMSLIPSIYKRLALARPRGQNRRFQHSYSNKTTISFVITRSDLLAPTKEMVDGLMAYFISVLRGALGSLAENIRLGNVHLVSSKRGWWTTDIKDDIWKRGGGNWMVGKVNVGKSNLFEVLFPKGSGDRAPSDTELEQAAGNLDRSTGFWSTPDDESDILLSEKSLLPPPQPASPFPVLPLVSNLPGTTASPIRLPFGRHRGELIDMPGLARGNLEEFVRPDHKRDLVMTHRPTVVQHIVKPGQSLLLGGGLVRVTPVLNAADPSTTMLAYAFVPIDAHVTATEKAIGAQLQQRESGIKSLLTDRAGEKMMSAGTFRLDNNVTKARAGPILNAGISVDRLPFRVFSTDLLVEGVGWVELVCQVRRRKRSASMHEASSEHTVSDALSHLDDNKQDEAKHEIEHVDDFELPRVEVFTPEGKHIGQRKPIGAWMMLRQASMSRQSRRKIHAARPRKPMKGTKKREKLAKRQAAVGQGGP